MTLTFIGPVAEQGGPAIKNALTLKYLHYDNVHLINTFSKSFSARLGSLVRTFACHDNQILVGVSRKGRALLWPIVRHNAPAVGGSRYGLICIGGTVAEEAARNHHLLSVMKDADIVAVETSGVKAKLASLGIFENVYLFPNFVEGIQDELRPRANISDDGSLRCVFLSSVRDKKGVGTMIAACRDAIAIGCDISLDIYGPIRNDFDRSILDGLGSSEPISYKGIVPKEQVMQTLARYDCFVFPSEYEAEGFPSVLAEAMAVGLPVIASDTCYNPEIVGENGGWLFATGQRTELTELFVACSKDREALKRVGARNVEYAQQWDASNVVGNFREQLIKKGWIL